VRLKNRLLLILLVYCLGLNSAVHAAEKADRHIFSTWESMEVDKCASIWLIKRFVDQDAQFKFFKRDDVISVGIQFDTPTAELRRYHNLSTFQSILNRYHLKDPILIEIGKRTFDIEINYWGEKRFEDSREIEAQIKQIIIESKSAEVLMSRSLTYFDALYERFRTGSKP
jgi:hypothetical protein